MEQEEEMNVSDVDMSADDAAGGLLFSLIPKFSPLLAFFLIQ